VTEAIQEVEAVVIETESTPVQTETHEGNAVIEQFSVAISEGILTSVITLRGTFGRVIFGGYALYLNPAYKNHRLESLAGHFLFKVLQVAGTADSNDLAGRLIRIRQQGERVIAIGHPIDDVWFVPEEDFAEVIARDEALISQVETTEEELEVSD
jgi:hypothetical protein